jgi:hypothetical protein
MNNNQYKNQTPYINQNIIKDNIYNEVSIANPINNLPDQTQDYLENQNNTRVGNPLLPIDNAVYNEDDEDLFSEEIKKKSNLLFEEKQVSAFKLYCHLSEAYEIFLMIMGTIAALAAGVAAPLMCYLFGDMANDFSTVNVDENQMDLLEQLMECKNEEEVARFAGGNPDKVWSYVIVYRTAKEMFHKFDKNVDDLVRKLLIIGACMFLAFGFEKFLWCYVGMRQMHHLK